MMLCLVTQGYQQYFHRFFVQAAIREITVTFFVKENDIRTA
jgi:hypothetical protein